jgi:hypothetical protein
MRVVLWITVLGGWYIYSSRLVRTAQSAITMNAPVFLAYLLFVAHQTLSGADVRLPQTVSPRHYDVRLFPILDKGDFFILGQVSIDLECSEDTNRIVLHSADIVVDPQSVQVQFYNILNHLIAVA